MFQQKCLQDFKSASQPLPHLLPNDADPCANPNLWLRATALWSLEWLQELLKEKRHPITDAESGGRFHPAAHHLKVCAISLEMGFCGLCHMTVTIHEGQFSSSLFHHCDLPPLRPHQEQDSE